MMTSIGSGSPEPEAALAGVLDVTLESSGSGGYEIGGGLFCYSSRPSHYLSRFHGSTSVEHITLGAPIEGVSGIVLGIEIESIREMTIVRVLVRQGCTITVGVVGLAVRRCIFRDDQGPFGPL